MSTARIPTTEITGVYGALAKRISRKKLGGVPESLGVMWHNLPVMKAFFSFSAKASRWEACDPSLKSFAHMAVAARVGCSFCLDLGYFEAHNKRLDLAKAREVPRWRESSLFTPLERDVLEYAEAATETPSAVTDELAERLLSALGAPALLELTAYVGFANLTSRTNAALGIASEGLAASCGLRPLAQPSGAVLSTT
ncbi:MAG TPA: carboxymuconolactone decarboxylase family protein [Conexibacter sp.]|nr:carboxymuconolactone decarboxylase family protein [Conexibacter sp.]